MADHETTKEELRMHLAQALSRTNNVEVEAHIRAALQRCDDLPPTELAECRGCGRIGLPSQIAAHDCA